MLKKIAILFSVVSLTYFYAFAYDQSGQKTKTSSATEVKKAGSASVVAPKGSKLIKKDGATFVEGLREYTSRKVSELEGRVKKLEAENSELKKSFEDLKKTVSGLQKAITVTAQKESPEQPKSKESR